MMNALTSERSTHMNAASRFQLFSIITKCIRLFSDSKVENKLAYIKKELQQIKKDNVALARYINARRKKEEAQRKEEAQKRWRSRPEGRRWCWRRRPMRAKAPRMSGLEGSSSPRMVQDLSLLLLAHIFC
jgi:anti-sigma factor RsiW